MGFMDELKKLTRPYAEEDEDFEEDFDLEERPRATRSAAAPRSARSAYDDVMEDLNASSAGASRPTATGRRTTDSKVVNIHTTAQMQVVLVKPDRFDAPFGGLPVRLCLCPGRQDQEDRHLHLHHHPLQCGHHRRPDRRIGKQRSVSLMPGRK